MRSASTSRAPRTRKWPPNSAATRRRSTTRSSGSSARCCSTSSCARFWISRTRGPRLRPMSAPPEIPVEGITLDELQLAARNHGLPLEALRYDVTPLGLHYLLIHYDIPVVDAASWRLEIGGAVERPLALTLDELRGRETVDL